MRLALRCLPLLMLLFPPGVLAQKKPGDEMIDRYLAARVQTLNRRFLDGAASADQWHKIRPRLRQEYLEMLGLWPLPEKTPLKATVTGTLTFGDVIIEKLHYQSQPGLYVTANLYRPAKAKGKLPGVLYVCGHSGRGRDGNKTAFADHGLWFASNGYVCLVVDTLQLGEIAGIHHGTYREGRWWWQARGYTPAGVECWNGIRGIDYLVSRDDVDAEKIAVTGISGGGATTVWVAAADERVKVAVPVSGMSDLESYVTNKVVNGHCDCMFLVNAHGWEWTTIAALIAPRPMLFANSDNDRIFPMDGNRRIINRLRQAYKMLGKPELVDEYVSKGGHDYRPDLRKAVFSWINRHIKNDRNPVEDAPTRVPDRQSLRVFPEDTDIPRDALNAKIDETFVPLAKVKLPTKQTFAAWQESIRKKLRAMSFKAFPDRFPLATVVARNQSDPPGVVLETEAGIRVRISVVRAADPNNPGGTLVVLNPDESPADVEGLIRQHAGKGGVVVLETRGGLSYPWTTRNPPNTVERSHALVGLTVDQGRVFDVASVVRYLCQENKGPWSVMGRKQAGVLAAYAALFEPDIAGVVASEPPVSHRTGPIFLNVLRVLDVPEALGLLAPRPLTLVGAKDRAFDRTQAIYNAANAAEKFRNLRE